jgi:TPR repeat protein
MTGALLHAQTPERKHTQALKSDRPAASPPLIIPSSTEARLVESFALVQQANAGNPPAQHELGLRYLAGQGFPADTSKAIFWIQKAADQGFPMANYNLGVLESNGWGTAWNPFLAFQRFRRAADGEMPQALYVVGMIYGENFVVPRNWPVAYGYFKRSYESGFEAAKEVMDELERRHADKTAQDPSATGATTPTATAARSAKQARPAPPRPASPDTAYSLVFVDYTSTDTVTVIPDTTLIRDAGRSLHGNIDREDAPLRAAADSTLRSDVLAAAEMGNPEALCLLGRLYERGIGVAHDPLQAGVCYLRALRLESFRAPGLLWRLVKSDEFFRNLRAGTETNNPDALYLWAGITALKFSSLLSDEQALRLLERAADAGHVPSMIELGVCHTTGRWVMQDRVKGLDWWNKAAAAGSAEAAVRVAIEHLMSGPAPEQLPGISKLLDSAATRGVLIADVARGVCYEEGIGRAEDKGEAYRVYHRSMRRGSQTALRALQRMHDELRPTGDEFHVTE